MFHVSLFFASWDSGDWFAIHGKGNANVVMLGPLPIPNIATYHNPNVRKKISTKAAPHFYTCLYTQTTTTVHARKLLYTRSQAAPTARRGAKVLQPVRNTSSACWHFLTAPLVVYGVTVEGGESLGVEALTQNMSPEMRSRSN